jgi:hypothetical protein
MNAICTVPLEDWYEELGVEELNPEYILLREEDEEANEEIETIHLPTEEANMTATTINNTPAFDLNAWMKSLTVATDQEVPATKIINKPEWLEIKGAVNAANAFAVTAGIVKAARRISDGLIVASRRHTEAVEAYTIQEARTLRVTGEKTFGPEMTKLGIQLAAANSGFKDAPGFNPDGVEFQDALAEAAEEIEKLEAIISNGNAMLLQLMDWIDEVAEELDLTVECGYTTTTDLIGNTFRKPRFVRLDRNTLLYGIVAQREFIKNNRK